MKIAKIFVKNVHIRIYVWYAGIISSWLIINVWRNVWNIRWQIKLNWMMGRCNMCVNLVRLIVGMGVLVWNSVMDAIMGCNKCIRGELHV